MRQRINVSDFSLELTLDCGQAFGWRMEHDGWFLGVLGKSVVRVRQVDNVLEWEAQPATDEARIRYYLALDVSLRDITATFPADDKPLHAAARRHWGLRVLRQESWECLASFIASSSKQIVQIRQIVELLAHRFGEPIGDGFHAFPTVEAIAHASHEQLLDCKLGFRAKNLLAAARMIDGGAVKLDALRSMEYERALEELVRLPGVGEKIANCVLLFSCGFDRAFPIDVWIERALRRLYFPRKRNVTHRQLREFARLHFGPHAGWAQQYLFLQERTRGRQPLPDAGAQR